MIFLSKTTAKNQLHVFTCKNLNFACVFKQKRVAACKNPCSKFFWIRIYFSGPYLSFVFIDFYIATGETYCVERDNVEVMENYFLSLETVPNVNDKKEVPMCYNSMGLVLDKFGNSIAGAELHFSEIRLGA